MLDGANVATRILSALGTYRLLTVRLMLLLGVAKDRKHLGEQLAVLVRKKWIGACAERDPGLGENGGRPETLYWLTRQGAGVLGTEPPAGLAAKGYRYTQTTAHTLGVLELQIRLARWAASSGIQIAKMIGDLEGRLGDRGKATAVELSGGELYAPDLVVIVDRPGDPSRVIVGEVYRQASLAHLMRQVESKLGPAADQEALENAHRAERRAVYLIVLETPGMLQAALRRWPQRICNGRSSWVTFRLASLDALRADFDGGWVNVDGKAASMLPKPVGASQTAFAGAG